jgi:hypothetical protein
VHLLIMAIPRFIQLRLPLPPISFKDGKGKLVRIIWRIVPPTKIIMSTRVFAALKADGSITAWGDSSSGGAGAPSDNGYTKIYSTALAFAALKSWYSHYQRVRLSLHTLDNPMP